jgi:hypothetical protein
MILLFFYHQCNNTSSNYQTIYEYELDRKEKITQKENGQY